MPQDTLKMLTDQSSGSSLSAIRYSGLELILEKENMCRSYSIWVLVAFVFWSALIALVEKGIQTVKKQKLFERSEFFCFRFSALLERYEAIFSLDFLVHFLSRKKNRENFGRSLNMGYNKPAQIAYILERQVNRPLSWLITIELTKIQCCRSLSVAIIYCL